MYRYPEAHRVGCLSGSKIITSLQSVEVATVNFRKVQWNPEECSGKGCWQHWKYGKCCFIYI